MNIVYLTIGIVMLLWGLLSLFFGIKNKGKGTMTMQSYGDSFLLRKIAGKSFNKAHNVLYGSLNTLLGLSIIIYFLRKIFIT